jgi:hypothetical protein
MNIKPLFLNLTFIGLVFNFNAQQADSVPLKISNWKLKSIQGFSTTQSSFVNWSAGGRTSFNFIGSIIASADYKKNKWIWDNDLALAFGGNKFFDTGDRSSFQKTDDKIDVSSEIGYEFHQKWYAMLLGTFKTQFVDGYKNSTDTLPTSRFMAPGYGNLSLGIEYKPNNHLSIFFSPVSSKFTFVQDQRLANEGAYGVRKANLDTTGLVLRKGSNFRAEFGMYFRLNYETNLAKNIDLKSKIELFSNYIDNPQNIDVNGELLLNFKVNDWFNASLAWNYIYDDDVSITDNEGRTGPRSQFKSVIGIGITYTVKNFKE